ncbi:hypothetical protein [Pseudomonas amygdali]|uniref:hypothetical protein n=1 Tax=Pseudomonas amygdali TaxID=47877 RepID=UPI0011C3EF37|nr:hypothetical protein [Pseudomonas amygdali]
MTYTPIISQDEYVIVVRCPICSGTVMNFVERFAGHRDLEDLEHYQELKFEITKVTVKRLTPQNECVCKTPASLQVKAISPSPSSSERPKAKPTGKPLLRMPKRA